MIYECYVTRSLKQDYSKTSWNRRINYERPKKNIYILKR